MAKPKTKAQLEADLEAQKTIRIIDGVVLIVRQLIFWGAMVLICRYIYLTLSEFAGRVTLTDIGINVLADIKFAAVVSIAAGAGGIIYGWRQKKLRKDTVERLQSRIKQLEERIDPGRTSSRLTSRGDSHPDDTP